MLSVVETSPNHLVCLGDPFDCPFDYAQGDIGRDDALFGHLLLCVPSPTPNKLL